MLNELFETFLREIQCLKNVSALTLRSYRQAVARFSKKSTEINKATFNGFVIRMRESGLAATSCNISIRSMNSFLTWLFENGHTTQRFKVQQLKTKKVTIKAYEDAELKRILSYKPNTSHSGACRRCYAP